MNSLQHLVDLRPAPASSSRDDLERFGQALESAWSDTLAQPRNEEDALLWMTLCAEYLDALADWWDPPEALAVLQPRHRALGGGARNIVEARHREFVADSSQLRRVVQWDALALSIAFSLARIDEQLGDDAEDNAARWESLTNESRRLAGMLEADPSALGQCPWAPGLVLHVLDHAGASEVRSHRGKWGKAEREGTWRTIGAQWSEGLDKPWTNPLAQPPTPPVAESPIAQPQLVSGADAYWLRGRSKGSSRLAQEPSHWFLGLVLLVFMQMVGWMLVVVARVLHDAADGKPGRGLLPITSGGLATSTDILVGLIAIMATLMVAVVAQPDLKSGDDRKKSLALRWSRRAWQLGYTITLLCAAVAGLQLFSWEGDRWRQGLLQRGADAALALMTGVLWLGMRVWSDDFAESVNVRAQQQAVRQARASRSRGRRQKAKGPASLGTKDWAVWGAALTVGSGVLAGCVAQDDAIRKGAGLAGMAFCEVLVKRLVMEWFVDDQAWAMRRQPRGRSLGSSPMLMVEIGMALALGLGILVVRDPGLQWEFGGLLALHVAGFLSLLWWFGYMGKRDMCDAAFVLVDRAASKILKESA